MQDDGQGHQEIVPSLLTQDTLNPSFYGMRIIATELEPLIDRLVAQVGLCLSLHGTSHEVCMRRCSTRLHQLHGPQSAPSLPALYPLACTGAELSCTTHPGSS